MPESQNISLAFVDGGQAEIISAGNFCLSFIRVFAQVFQNGKKTNSCKNEFYLLSTAKYNPVEKELYYEAKIYPLTEKIISEEELIISSQDQTIKTGSERAPISKVSNIARRLAELSLAAKIKADFIVLDGTLETTFKNEEKYLSQLPANICAIAKSSSLFTTSGNSPVILLNKISPAGCWSYLVEKTTKFQTYFVKLHPQARHIFRFSGNPEVLPYLVQNSTDALFLGYPYGLILVDQLARVGNTEKASLKMNFLLRKENQEIFARQFV